MMLRSSICITLICAALATAVPIKTTLVQYITPEDLIKIAPSTNLCDGASFPSECATAYTAAPYIANSFTSFNITTFPVQAALVALQLYESGNFQYSQNHWPGIPGQGTRNMQSPAFNDEYATWLSTICTNCISESDVSRAKAAGPVAVLALVNVPEFSFMSAAWFLRTQCDESILQGLDSGSEDGWSAYLQECVGTEVNDERTAIWEKVMALNQW